LRRLEHAARREADGIERAEEDHAARVMPYKRRRPKFLSRAQVSAQKLRRRLQGEVDALLAATGPAGLGDRLEGLTGCQEGQRALPALLVKVQTAFLFAWKSLASQIGQV